MWLLDVNLPKSTPKFAGPDACTPKHLAEKILTSKSALEGERKQVTVLFADLKGSWGSSTFSVSWSARVVYA